MSNYFNNIKSINDLKQKYKELAKKYHPDLGGDANEFKIMQNDYERLFYNLSNEETKEAPGHLINLLNKISFLFKNDDANIELVGSWLWISFDKKPEGDIINRLKLAGLRWSIKNKKWFTGGDNLKYKPIKTKLNFGDIVARYGVNKINNTSQKLAIE